MSKKIDWYIVDKCSQPAKEAGSCYDYVLRYSYVSSSGDCEPFYYGGCEGNDNRFESADECEAECSGVAEVTTWRPPARTTQRPHLPDRTVPPIGRSFLHFNTLFSTTLLVETNVAETLLSDI